jgi:penicillin-binding protein 1A
MSLRMALAKSDNHAAQWLLERVGPKNAVEWARALGIQSNLQPTPSLALGAYEVTPLELAGAFAVMASGGELRPPKLITSITEPGGGALEPTPLPPARRVMTPEEAYLTTSLLRSVVTHGTGARARSLERPVAGKTGTTNEARDAWFVGYSTDLVVAAWVGYDDASPLGPGESGSRTALPIWVDFMRAAHARRPVTQFPRPAGIVSVAVDPSTGLLAYPGQADAIEEEFLEGTAPTETALADAGVEAGAARETDPTSAADAAAAPSEPSPEVAPRGLGGSPADASAIDASDVLEDEPPPF